MGVKSRVERLEDQLLPKAEITGPYPPKKMSEESLAEFHRLLEEHYQKYPPINDFEPREHGELKQPLAEDSEGLSHIDRETGRK